jgi:uncharacterized protein (TIGR00251 family)
MATEVPIRRREDGVIVVRLHVQPGASATQPAGRHGDRIKIRLKARPVEGAANRTLLDWLATGLHLPKSAITLLRGDTSRQKEVAIEGADLDAVCRLLDPAAG